MFVEQPLAKQVGLLTIINYIIHPVACGSSELPSKVLYIGGLVDSGLCGPDDPSDKFLFFSHNFCNLSSETPQCYHMMLCEFFLQDWVAGISWLQKLR